MSKERQARTLPNWLNGDGGNGVGRAPRPRWPGGMALVGLAVAALLAAGLASTSQAATLKATLRSHLLSVADLPYGWSAAPVTSTKGKQVTTSPCGAALVAALSSPSLAKSVLSPPSLAKSPLGPTYDTASFVEGVGLPSFHEALASGVQAEEAWQRFGATLADCRAATFAYKEGVSKGKAVATRKPMSMARLGRSSSAYAWTIREASALVGLDVDVILFQTAGYYGYLSYSDVGPLQVPTVTAFARAAVAKATKGSTAPVPDTGLDRFCPGTNGAHHARHGRLPRHRLRPSAGDDRRLERDDG